MITQAELQDLTGIRPRVGAVGESADIQIVPILHTWWGLALAGLAGYGVYRLVKSRQT